MISVEENECPTAGRSMKTILYKRGFREISTGFSLKSVPIPQECSNCPETAIKRFSWYRRWALKKIWSKKIIFSWSKKYFKKKILKIFKIGKFSKSKNVENFSKSKNVDKKSSKTKTSKFCQHFPFLDFFFKKIFLKNFQQKKNQNHFRSPKNNFFSMRFFLVHLLREENRGFRASSILALSTVVSTARSLYCIFRKLSKFHKINVYKGWSS